MLNPWKQFENEQSDPSVFGPLASLGRTEPYSTDFSDGSSRLINLGEGSDTGVIGARTDDEYYESLGVKMDSDVENTFAVMAV